MEKLKYDGLRKVRLDPDDRNDPKFLQSLHLQIVRGMKRKDFALKNGASTRRYAKLNEPNVDGWCSEQKRIKTNDKTPHEKWVEGLKTQKGHEV